MKYDFLEKINTGEVTMAPRWHFIVRGVFIAIVIAMIFAVSSFLASFIFFAVRMTGLADLPGDGWGGVRMFMIHFPWVILSLDLILVLLLMFMLSRYQVFYSQPVIVAGLSVALIVVLVGFVTRYNSTHRTFRQTFRGTPGLSRMYMGHRLLQDKNIIQGKVVEFGPDYMILSPLDFQSLNVPQLSGDMFDEAQASLPTPLPAVGPVQMLPEKFVRIKMNPKARLTRQCCKSGDEAVVFFQQDKDDMRAVSAHKVLIDDRD